MPSKPSASSKSKIFSLTNCSSSITKIFIADRNGNTISLDRQENRKWLINNKYKPRPDFLKLMLDVIYQIDVRNRVAKAAYNNVIKMLASNGIKCEIYLNNSKEPFKTYYVGGQTEDALGTFMIIENSTMPFVTEISGFDGYLTPRYSTDLESWRLPALFQTSLADIKSLMVSYANFPEKSFLISSDNDQYHVQSPATNKSLIQIDSVAIENYLSFYANVFFEARAKDLIPQKKDSMLLSTPSIIISLTDKNGISREVNIYPMTISGTSLAKVDLEGNPLKYDVDRVYGFIKPEKEFVIIQHYTFDKLLRQISDFESKKITGLPKQ